MAIQIWHLLTIFFVYCGAQGADVNVAPVPSSRDTVLTISADEGQFKLVELLLKLEKLLLKWSIPMITTYASKLWTELFCNFS